MAKEKVTFISIDVGSTNVRALAAQSTPAGDIEIIAAGQAPSLGIQRGIIVNVDEASFAIRKALEDAGLDGKARYTQVYAGIGGKHIASANRSQEVRVSRTDGLIGERDVLRATDAVRAMDAGEGMEIIHAIPRSYRVDGYLCRRSPIGMRGPTVGVESHIVTADAAGAASLRRAVQMAGKDAATLVINGIASAQAVLTQEEMEKGVVLADIGGGTTHIVAFAQGAPVHTSVLPVGGNQIVNDLAIALNIPQHVADRLYLDEGCCSPETPKSTDELSVRCFGPTGTRTLRRSYLYDVIRLRVEEILRMAFLRGQAGAPEMSAPGALVVTGGVAGLRGLEALGQKALQVPVRIGSPIESPVEPSELASPLFAAAIGMIRLASAPHAVPVPQPNGAPNGLRSLPRRVGLKARAAS